MDHQEGSLAEITVKAVVLGVLLSVILAAANAYLGLFAGMTVSASIPAAVVSMGVLRLFRRSNILENNIVQTAASAGESLAAGVIFTLPALVILGFWDDFDFLWVTVIAGFGGLLGVLFTIPLRRALIVESKLKFPEGIATAEVLKSGQRSDGSGIKYIAQAAIAGGLFKLGGGGLKIWFEAVEAAKGIGGTIAYFGSNLSPALLSVGYIVGLNIAVLIFLGGVANWLVAIPICALLEEWPSLANGEPMAAVDWAHQIWSAKTRYIGVGGMLVGGLWTIIKLRTSLVDGIKSGLKAYRGTGEGAQVNRTERDMPMKWVLILIIFSVVPLFLVYQAFVKDVTIAIPMAITMLITGFLFSAVAGYMAGLVGSSNNPISGVTIATVLVSALLLLVLMGKGAENGPAAAIIIGSVVCCAAAIAGDNMQDLKAGYIVGATPWKQQVMQMIGTVSAALVMAPILMLLYKA
ncbi:MAG: oligopeptide transporter, OPT family, partial [Planctomycetes bacterium]|nr:oligopeptide transporter, OPT family [Planctomycetota bacterium]